MTTENTGLYSMTAPAVMAFVALTTPKKFKDRNGKETGEAKFGVTFVFPPEHPDLKGMKDAAIAVARAKWPGVKLADLKFPFEAGEKTIEARKRNLAKKSKEYKGETDFALGKSLLKAASKYPAGLAAIINGKVIDLDTPDKLSAHGHMFFFGAEGLGQVTFQAYDPIKEGDKAGVTCYINKVLVTGKGERLTKGMSAAETFSGYVGKTTTEDPTGPKGETLDDDIPF